MLIFPLVAYIDERTKIASSIWSNEIVALITQDKVGCGYLEKKPFCAPEQNQRCSLFTCFLDLLIFVSYRNFSIWKERMCVLQKNKRITPFLN